jgi:hypothetical protein
MLHMAGKGWVDLPDFAEALRIARRRWRKKDDDSMEEFSGLRVVRVEVYPQADSFHALL